MYTAQHEQQIRKRIVGKFLQKRREKAKKTQWDTAHFLGYSTAQFISNWERGISLPPMDAYAKIASFYEIGKKEFEDMLVKFEEEMLKQQKRLIKAMLREIK